MKPSPGEPDSPLPCPELSAGPDSGLLLPCNVVMRESADGGLVVGLLDTVDVMQMTSSPEVAPVAQEVRARLERVRAALA